MNTYGFKSFGKHLLVNLRIAESNIVLTDIEQQHGHTLCIERYTTPKGRNMVRIYGAVPHGPSCNITYLWDKAKALAAYDKAAKELGYVEDVYTRWTIQDFEI